MEPTTRDDIPQLCDFELQSSPYYNEDHHAYRRHVRKFVNEYISKYWNGDDSQNNTKYLTKKGFLPRDFYTTLARYDNGSLYSFPFGYGPDWTNPETNKKVKFDPFFTIIFCYETYGAQGGLGAWIHYIALPPLLHFGNNDIHKQVIKEVLNGDKLISLAISELTGGSDVANLKTTAVLSEDKKNFILNGTKYWITGGNRADYFVTIARTTSIDEQKNGLSLFLVPRIKGQVFTSKLEMQGAELNETASVTFVNCKIPYNNLIGKLNDGFKPLMYNFNFERFVVAADTVAMQRMCIEESIKWAIERKTFNKPLIKHQVIRHKIADMSRQCLASQLMLEKCAFQLKSDQYGRKDKTIAKNIALLKVQCTKSLQNIVNQSSQIFGGRSYIRGGRGGRVETAYRGARASAIAAGSEEIMYDLAVRQAKL